LVAEQDQPMSCMHADKIVYYRDANFQKLKSVRWAMGLQNVTNFHTTIRDMSVTV